jgi:hypothetical protein
LEDWRAKALELFPDLADLIAEETAAMGLWIELYVMFVRTYDEVPLDEDFVGKVYEYAAWCFAQPSTGSAATDPSSAAAVGFIEDIPTNKRISEDLHRWMSVESFDGFENLFRYMLSDEEYEKFAAGFRERKKNFNGPTRL